ncbi:MAG: bifunctional folylpolyglutamate synthase/dihydrofolate synthase [Candidatus Bipolaricaulota bacterium]|nr:bifunctional folylpolyglutamate synthase/dihydrofolate synthase [Candidatus Bipolaricaulota bacterium]MDW8030394.1 folylpolyglutamate synthase/dihydrofolate synthase family protein [Candidatus Bipolaricaulota bacterium]
MTYEAMLQKLYNLKGSGLELERVVHALGDPQKSFRAIRVAGTNGKGSVCAFLAQILQEAGFRVGLFTSPHLVHPEERIRVNSREISPEEFQAQFERIWTVIEGIYGTESERYARFFEVLTLMALEYFRAQKVDWAVIECGVGARTDATRIVSAEVSVLTNVELDHTDSLGKTIAQIAYQKAAVVSEGGTLITAEHKQEALAEIARECRWKNARLIQLDLSRLHAKSNSWDGQRFDWRVWQDLEISLLGNYQLQNAVLAIEAANALGERAITESAIRAGLRKARWPGRMELLHTNPYIMLDGAKNPAGMRALRAALSSLKYERCIVVLGISDRKDAAAMIHEIVPIADHVIVTRASFRGVDPEYLASLIDGVPCTVAPSPESAIKLALTQARGGDLICVTGSLFLVGEVRARWKGQEHFCKDPH